MGESNRPFLGKGCDVGDEAGGGAIGGNVPDGCVLGGLGLGISRWDGYHERTAIRCPGWLRVVIGRAVHRDGRIGQYAVPSVPSVGVNQADITGGDDGDLAAVGGVIELASLAGRKQGGLLQSVGMDQAQVVGGNVSGFETQARVKGHDVRAGDPLETLESHFKTVIRFHRLKILCAQ